MANVDGSLVLHLREGLTLTALDTGAREQEYVAVSPDGGHYRLTSRLQEVVECIDGQRTLAEVASVLSRKWQRSLRPDQVWDIAQRYLAPNGLLQEAAGSVAPTSPVRLFGWHTRLLSARQVQPITRIGRQLFAWPIVLISLALIALVHVAVYREMSGFSVLLAHAIGSGDFLIVYGLTIASVLVHEIGHASACHRFGEQYGDIGIGLYIIFPVFYTDVTRIWRLSRWRRVIVDLAGIYFQLLVTVFYYLMYRLTGNAVWLLVIFQIDLLVTLAFNPIAKFDGYWLVSDILGVPNLHRRLGQMLRRLRGRANASGFTLKPIVEAGLWVYLALTVAVFGYLAVTLVAHGPELLRSFVTAIGDTFAAIGSGWQAGDIGRIGAGLVRLLSPVATILGLFILLGRLLKPIVVRRSTQSAVP